MVNSRIRVWAGVGIFLAVIVVSVGAYTRLVDAGLGCPDWPGCYGFLGIPESDAAIQQAEARFPEAPYEYAKAFWEMFHRYLAGSLLLLVGGLAFLAWRNRAQDTPVKLVTALSILILCQAAFGAWTVTLKLWPQVVTAHLLGGFTTLSLIWVLFLRQGGLPMLRRPESRFATHAKVALAVVIAQIALGGWVSSNYAALACYDFPSCDGSYSPTMDLASGFNFLQGVGPNYLGGLLDSEARVAIHWVHRIGAIIALLVIGSLALRLMQTERILASLLATTLGVQILLGILNVVWVLPLSTATLHNTFGALLLLAVVTVNFAPQKTTLSAA